jgi:hypothetical protein
MRAVIFVGAPTTNVACELPAGQERRDSYPAFWGTPGAQLD